MDNVEREAIVTWLRFYLDDWPDYVSPEDIADAIERGDHLIPMTNKPTHNEKGDPAASPDGLDP